MKHGDYKTACSEFDESERLDPSPGTVLNLALCEERSGHLTRAQSLIELFLANAREDDDRRGNARLFAKDLDARVPRLVVHLEPSGVRGTQVLVDGVNVTLEPEKPFSIDPGPHKVQLVVPGYSAQTAAVEVAEGELVERRFVLSRVAVVPSSVVVATQRNSSPLSPLFYVSLGIGIAGTLTAIESGAVVLAERATVHDHCVEKQCDPTGLAAGRRGKTFALINTIALPTAIAGTALAAYLFIARKRNSSPHYGLGISFAAQRASLVFEANTP